MKTRKYKTRKIRPTRKYSLLRTPIVKYETNQLSIRSKLRGHPYTPNWKIHRGGFQKTLHIDGYSFVYDETMQQILCLSKDNKSVCFKIDFDVIAQSIGISIGYFPSCSVNKDLPESSGTLIMMKAILSLIFQHPDIHKFTNIEINDTSHILVSSFEDGKKYKTRLMDMYFLSTGCTWYASLLHMFLKYVNDDDNYTIWRTNILSSKWTDFLNSMTSDKMPITVEERKTYFDFKKQPNDSLTHEVLNSIRKERTHSILFYKYMDHMLVWLGVLSLYSKPWIIPIRNGKVLCPTDGSIPLCENEKGWGIPASLMEYISPTEYNRIKSGLQVSEVEVNEFSEFSEIRKEGRVYTALNRPTDEIEFNDTPESLNTLLYKLYK